MMAEEDPQAGTITTAQAARLLMLSDERIRQLVKDGYIPRVAQGRFNLVAVVQGYIRFLKDEERRSSKSAADNRVRKPGGKPVWVRRAKDNHYLDCEAMNAAAAFFLGVQRLRDEPARKGTNDAPGTSAIPVLPGRKQSMADWSAMLNR